MSALLLSSQHPCHPPANYKQQACGEVENYKRKSNLAGEQEHAIILPPTLGAPKMNAHSAIPEAQ